jgi:hypothetical protein
MLWIVWSVAPTAQPGPLGSEHLLIGGDEACLPVVAVDDVARLLEPVGQFEDGSGEEDETFGVVRIILGAPP